MKKTSLITGVAGQDGYYLSKELLERGYHVVGLDLPQTKGYHKELKELMEYPCFKFIEGDICDRYLIRKLLIKEKPRFFFNMAAISHVAVSFTIPERVTEVNYLAVIRILEEIRAVSPKTAFLQASTSEMYGNNHSSAIWHITHPKINKFIEELNQVRNQDIILLPPEAEIEFPKQTEESPMRPNSPYAIAKTGAFFITQLYRKYGLKTYNTICFNHESVPQDSPLIIKRYGSIEILPIEDLFMSRGGRIRDFCKGYENCEVWTGKKWTKIITGTAYKNRDKPTKIIQTRKSSYEATGDHIAFIHSSYGPPEEICEIATENIKLGNKLVSTVYPDLINRLSPDKRLAYIIGYIIGDGYIDPRGGIRLTNSIKKEIMGIAAQLNNLFGWKYRISTYGPGSYENCTKNIWQLDFNNDSNFGKWLRKEIYTKHTNKKKIPSFILNSDIEIKKSFIEGYYLADGRKKGNEKYQYKGFTTSSATLCLGLNILFKEVFNQISKTKCDYKNGKRYYYTQLRSPKTNLGKGLIKEPNEVIKIIPTNTRREYLFDIQTESESFATGPNLVKVHNSPIRPETFVTRKITKFMADIKLNQELGYTHPVPHGCLTLGNLEAQRDWGYAQEYCQAMIQIMESGKPDDFVISTGEVYSVKEFIEECCRVLHFDLEWRGKGIKEVGYINHTPRIFISKEFYRPADINHLCGDPNKIKRDLGWEPKVKFKELVRLMLKSDLKEKVN